MRKEEPRAQEGLSKKYALAETGKQSLLSGKGGHAGLSDVDQLSADWVLEK